MEENTKIDVQQIKMAMFRRTMVTLKKSLPNSVTHLSTLKKSDGKVYIKAVVNKKDYLYTIPQDFDMNTEDWKRLEQLIKSNCDVTERS